MRIRAGILGTPLTRLMRTGWVAHEGTAQWSDVSALPEHRAQAVPDASLWLTIAGPIFLILCAAELWVMSLKVIDVRRMTDLGLVSVLPLQSFLALIIITVSFCLTLRSQPLSVPLLLAHVVVLIFMLYGVTALVEDGSRVSITWRHAGFTEYIMRTGTVAPKLDARFNWPTFFILSAFITQVAGLPSIIPLTAWAPVFFNVLYLGALAMILDSLTNDKRLVWLGIWLFYITNWIGQDYFAPQAFNYFLYLVILGILLKWFKGTTVRPQPLGPPWQNWRVLSRLADRVYTWLTPVDLPNSPSWPGQRAGLLTIVVATFIVVASSHQLTPFFVVVSTSALVLFRRCSLRSLPLLMGIIAAAWISFMTVAFLSGHSSLVMGNIGQVNEALTSNVTGRLNGSPEHMFVLYLRLLVTFSLWGLAFLGAISRLRKGFWDLTCALLTIAPCLLFGLQDYGGELILRTYLFTLPFVAFFAAGLYYTTPSTPSSWRRIGLIGVTSLLLLSGFLFTRYGNERMDYMSAHEVSASDYLYSIARPKSLIVTVLPNLPLKYRDFEKFTSVSVLDDAVVGDVEAIVQIMKNQRYTSSYLILARSEYANGELFYGLSRDWGHNLEKTLLESGQFRLIYQNQDAMILVLATKSGVKPS